MTPTTAEPDLADSPYAWSRLLISLMLATIGGIGLWSVIIALPTIQAAFEVDRGLASAPYLMTMIGFAAGGVFMGRMSDRFGIRVPLLVSSLVLCAGYILAAQAQTIWQFIAVQAVLIGMFGSSTTFGPLVADITLWFRRRRPRRRHLRQRQLHGRGCLVTCADVDDRGVRLARFLHVYRPGLSGDHGAAFPDAQAPRQHR